MHNTYCKQYTQVARAPSVIFLRKCHLPPGGRLFYPPSIKRARHLSRRERLFSTVANKKPSPVGEGGPLAVDEEFVAYSSSVSLTRSTVMFYLQNSPSLAARKIHLVGEAFRLPRMRDQRGCFFGRGDPSPTGVIFTCGEFIVGSPRGEVFSTAINKKPSPTGEGSLECR